MKPSLLQHSAIILRLLEFYIILVWVDFTMTDLLRDAPVGQLIRFLTGARYLKYPEEDVCFSNPFYLLEKNKSYTEESPRPEGLGVQGRPSSMQSDTADFALVHSTTLPASTGMVDEVPKSSMPRDSLLAPVTSRVRLETVRTMSELEDAYLAATEQGDLKQQPSQAIVPTITASGVILVDWYSTDDPANPQNWSLKKKLVVSLQIW